MSTYKFLLLVVQLLFVSCETNLYRLPENVWPTSYVLTIDTDLDTMIFTGTASILLDVTSDTKSFSLHSKDLSIEKVTLLMGGVNVVDGFNFTTTADLLNVYTSQVLSGKNHKLEIEYTGTVGSGNVGYYRAYYVDEDSKNVAMAVTHLEATNARRAFPCFDQPNFKAKFQVNLIRKLSQVTSSNMALYNTSSVDQNRVMDTYETSVDMSTYLVAFMVSEYESLSKTVDGKLYTTFARPELLKRGDANYSLEIGPKCISQMETFTNIKYPFDKMDQVPVPNDYYKIGAMENWGMVTYRERMLMYNKDLSTAQEKQSVATIIVHEFAHQWFGDLVTPEWWNYIWLNEGFATYFEQYITSLIETSWDLMAQFVTSNIQPAFDDDAIEGSRPMSRDVETPTEIDGIYDTIVYEKAGSVIRMTEEFLGATVFRQGLQNYLKKWSYLNVNPTKLYDSWSEALGTNFNVTAVLHSWETQAGYPVVTVTRSYGSDSNSIALKQERFYIDGKTRNDATKWMIPVNYFTESNAADPIIWLNTATSTVKVTVNTTDWIIFNRQRKGFYRVNYDDTNWKLITDYLQTGKFDAIPVENRAQLIDDAFNLARSGRLKYNIALELGRYVLNENHYVPISTFNTVFSFLDKLSTGHEHHSDLKEYAVQILEPIYKKLGFAIASSETHLNKLTKVNVNTWLCKHGYAACLQESEKVLTSWLTNVKVQPDMQGYVYCYGMRGADKTRLDAVMAKYSSSKEDTERARIATGLGCAENSTVQTSLLQNLITQNILTQTDKLNAISSVYTNNGAGGVETVLDFLTTNFQGVNEKIGNTARIISGVAARIVTGEQFDKFTTFAKQNGPSMTEALQNTLTAANKTALDNISWITENKGDIASYLAGGSSATISCIVLVFVCAFVHFIY